MATALSHWTPPTGPLTRSVCRAFVADVVRPALKKLRTFKKAGADVAAFAEHLPALLRTGSLDAHGLAARLSGGPVDPVPRFQLDPP